MNCVNCDRPAHGICKFCGRALCKDHFKKSNFILAIYPTPEKTDKVLVVENVVKCEICRPLEHLVEINLNGSDH